ncbi:hypothetical protein HDU84_005152 [Entophlyctis sp. JEL0112]|nr:hypothetical protein HDU84_005152 [Entophlyctis sp. JEL0112]
MKGNLPPSLPATTPPSYSNSVVPATIPTSINVQDGIEWLTFCYEVKGSPIYFRIRTDIDHLDVDRDMTEEFKMKNCIYIGASVDKVDYKGHRYEYENSVNHIGWKLCYMNPELCEKKGLIQRAVDSFRNRFEKLRSRRVVRSEKVLNGNLRFRSSPSFSASSTPEQSSVNRPSKPSVFQDSKHQIRMSAVATAAEIEGSNETFEATEEEDEEEEGKICTDLTPTKDIAPFVADSYGFAVPEYGSVSPELVIARHLEAKLKQPKQTKTIAVETVIGGEIYRLRVNVDIERVDAILGAATEPDQPDVVAANNNDAQNKQLQTINSTTSRATLPPGSVHIGVVTDEAKDCIRRFSSSLPFRRGNSVFPRACDGFSAFFGRMSQSGLLKLYCELHNENETEVTKYLAMINSGENADEAKGTRVLEALKERYEQELLTNEIAWRIAVLNRKGLTSQEYGGNGCRELLQRAVDTYLQRYGGSASGGTGAQ